MNRRDFLKGISKAAAVTAIAPIIPFKLFSPRPKEFSKVFTGARALMYVNGKELNYVKTGVWTCPDGVSSVMVYGVGGGSGGGGLKTMSEWKACVDPTIIKVAPGDTFHVNLGKEIV